VSPRWNGSDQANIIWYAQKSHSLITAYQIPSTNASPTTYETAGLVRTIVVAGTHVISQMEKNSAARAKIKVIQPTLQTFLRLGQFQRLYQF